MAVSIAHAKSVTIADSADTSIVRPSDWNSGHVIVGLGDAAEYNVGTNATQIPLRSQADALYFAKSSPTSVDPSGFPDRTQVTLSWSNATRTLTITPVGSTFDIWVFGVKWTKTGTQTFTIANTTGAHYVYYGTDGELHETTAFDSRLIFGWAYVSEIWWNATGGYAVPDATDERHGTEWPAELHYQQHVTTGTRYQNGLVPTFSLGSGASTSDLRFSATSGTIWDEDIPLSVTARATTDNIPVLFRTGTSAFDVDESSPEVVRVGAGGFPYYNLNTGGTWSRAEVTDGNYTVAYIYATNGLTKKWMVITGQSEYGNEADANTAARTAPTMTGFPSPEYKCVAAVIIKADSAAVNGFKSYIVANDTGSAWIDWRYTSANSGIAAGTGGGGGGGVAVAAGGATYSTGTANFGNSNGFSFLTSGGLIVGSYTQQDTSPAFLAANSSLLQHTSATSAITSAAFPTANSSALVATSASSLLQHTSATSAITSNAFPTANSTALVATSVSSLFQHTSATSAITANAMNTSERGNYFYTSNNTFANNTHTHGAIAFGGTNITGNFTSASNGLSMSLSVGAGGAADGYNSAQFTNSTANSTQPLLWAGNSNGSGNVTIGLTGSTITMSANAGGAGDGYNIIGVNGGATQLSTTYQLSNANNVTFGLNAGTITASASYPAQTVDTGKAGTGFTSAGANVGLSGTLNTNGLSLSATVAAQSVQPVAFSASGGSSNFSTLNFANSNGITFTNTNGSVAAQHALQYTSNTSAIVSDRALSTHTHGSPTLNLTNISGTTNSASNGLTLSLSGVAAQTTQTQPAGNIAGVGTTFGGTNVSGSMTLNSNGLALSLSAPTPGGGAAINVSAGTTSGNLQTIQFNNANGVSFGLNGSTVTASVNAGGGGLTRQSFDNMGPLNTVQGGMGTKALVFRSLSFFPLKPFQDIFNGSMTVNTLGIDVSFSGSTATMSAAATTTAALGLYTINTTAATLSLGLVNSVAITLGLGANANNSNSWAGQRFFTAHSSQWSSQPVLSDGVQYVCGLVFDSAGVANQSNTVLGGFFGSTAARSGFIGVAQTAATHNGIGQFLGHYSATTQGLPSGVNYTQIHKQSASGNFIPHIIGFNHTNGGLL